MKATATAHATAPQVREADIAWLDEDRPGARVGSLADALEHARAGQLEQLDEDVDLKQLLDGARETGDRPARRGGHGTGLPSGRMPDRGVDRPPFGDEGPTKPIASASG